MRKPILGGSIALLVWVFSIASVQAQTRARLDRNPVSLGETVTLSIESDLSASAPDVTPLMADFELVDQSSSRSMQMVNGRTSSRTVYRLTLEPKRAGELIIPALQVGAQRTAPIALTVRPAPPVNTRDGNAAIFLETEVDDSHPYVQQSVGVTLRLYYAVPLVSGELDLDTPDGALLQKVGEDVQGSRDINGRRYNLVERRFLLVPERSGPLTIPGPRFNGRGAGGWIDDFLGGNSRELRAAGAPRQLKVRAQPANAPQPWLPLRDLRLRYVAAPSSARAGEATTIAVELVALGATQAQLPELPVPSAPGVQVFPEPPQYDETFVDGTPQVRLTRKYAVVPAARGTLRVTGIRMPWWDVSDGMAKTAALPDLTLSVAAGGAPAVANAGTTLATPSVADNAVPLPVEAPVARVWIWLTVGFAVLWLLTLIWALQRRQSARSATGPSRAHGAMPASATLPMRTLADLKRALDTGSLDEVADSLCGMAAPPLADLDGLMARLDSRAQRDAIEQLRRARWADGDGVAARVALRAAFAQGPLWKSAPAAPASPLPPLYPER